MVAPAVSLWTLSGDAAYIASVVRQIVVPVVLVGHFHGGAVITIVGDVEENGRPLFTWPTMRSRMVKILANCKAGSRNLI
ncbi:hypothetical protein [Amycolatopsis sp. NPDC003861]